MAKNPIDPTQRERLNGARRRAKSCYDLLQSCKAAGIDVSEREQVLFEVCQALDAIHNGFVGELNPADVVFQHAPEPAPVMTTPAENRQRSRKGKGG